MDVIIKNNDDSFYYLFKKLSSKYDVKYIEKISSDINKLIINKVDNLGYIKDTNILLEDIIKDYSINKLYIEEDSHKLLKLLKKYNIDYKIFSSDFNYINKLNKLKSEILLKFILEDSKESIYNLNILLLGNNNLSYNIENMLKKFTSFDKFTNNNLNIELYKYDIIINTSNYKVNPELLFNVKKSLIIYDLEPNTTTLDRNILNNNLIKYKIINNVSLYLPIAKANILESMCDYESI